MSRKIFDKNLFLEGMRQNRVQGFLYLFLLMLYSVMNPIWYYLSADWAREGSNWTIRVLSLMDMNPALLIVMYLFGALLMAHVFRFLHQRNSSDFYHAIPQTRLCLYVSFFASAVAWMTILLVVPTVTCSILFSVQRNFFRIQIAEVVNSLFHIWVGALYIMSIVAVALSVTGTMFSCVIVSCMICFLPRLYVWYVESCVGENLPMVISGNGLIPHFPVSLNIPLGFILVDTYLLSGVSRDFNVLLAWQSLAYTGALSVIFILLAAVLFHRRKSESASLPSVSRFLQSVFRFLAAFTASLIPVGLLYSDMQNRLGWNWTLSDDELFWIVVLYILVLVVYFVYELVTTRKWKNLVRIIPGVLFIFAADAALFFGMMKLQEYHSSFEPSADEITSVALVEDNRYYANEYFNVAVSQVEMNSEKARELACEGLSRVLQDVRQHGYLTEGRTRAYTGMEEGVIYVTTPMAIRSNGQVFYRYIYLTNEETMQMYTELGKDPDYMDAFRKLPENPVVATVSGLTEEEARELYRAAVEEIAALPFEKAYDLLTGRTESFFPDIAFSAELKGKIYYDQIPLDLVKLPETTEKYLRIKTEKQNTEELLSMLRDMETEDGSTKTLYGSVTVNLPNGNYLFYSVDDFRIAEMKPEDKEPVKEPERAWKYLLKEKEVPYLTAPDIMYLAEKYKDTERDTSLAVVVLNIYMDRSILMEEGWYENERTWEGSWILFANPEEFVD